MPLAEILAAVVLPLAGWFAHAAVTRQLLRAARRDPVTGLPTRAAWTARARRMLRRRGPVVALVDLDLFKVVNDTCGHQAGDQVLASTAARIRAWLDGCGGGEGGRLGGGEFALATRHPVTAQHLNALASLLAQPVTLLDGITVRVGASVGAARSGPGTGGLSAALAAADAAMYAAKRSGGGCRISEVPQAAALCPRAGPASRIRRHGTPVIPAGISRVSAEG